MLEILPAEILELIYLHLDPQSCISLQNTSSNLQYKLDDSTKFHQHVCECLGLDTPEWSGEKSCQTSGRNLNFWKSLYKKWFSTDLALSSRKIFDVDRIMLDINNLRMNAKSNIRQRVLKLPESQRQVPDYKHLRRKLISESIFSYAVSDLYFILIVSSSKSYKSHLSVWNTSNTISYTYSISQYSAPKSDLPNLWVACSEDVMVYTNLLIIMATQAEPSNFFNEARPSNKDLIHVYDLDKGSEKADVAGFLVAKYTLAASVRFLPIILKEGGGSKLMAWGNLLLAVCPETSEDYYKYEPDTEPTLVIRCFDLAPVRVDRSGVQEMVLVGEHRLSGVKMKQPYSYIASDQKGPNIVMSFSKQDQHEEFLSQQFVILSLRCKETFISSIRTFNTTNMSRIPSLLNLDFGVRRREQSLIAVGEKFPVFATMDASGLVQLADGLGKFKQFYPVYGISDDFDTFYDELHIYGERVVIMKIFLNREMSLGSKNTILAVTNFAGELLWKIKTNIVSL